VQSISGPRFHVGITLKGLLSKLASLGGEVELAGSAVHWFLEGCPEERPPNDFDLRVYTENGDHLFDAVCAYFADCYLASQGGLYSPSTTKFVQERFFPGASWVCCPEKELLYLPLMFGDGSCNIELMLVAQMGRRHLFTRDALRLSLTPLLAEGRGEPAFVCEIERERVFADRKNRLIDADSPEAIDEMGWPRLIVYLCLGHTSAGAELERTLCRKSVGCGRELGSLLRKGWLKHYRRSVEFYFNACESLRTNGFVPEGALRSLLPDEERESLFLQGLYEASLEDGVLFSSLSAYLRLMALTLLGKAERCSAGEVELLRMEHRGEQAVQLRCKERYFLFNGTLEEAVAELEGRDLPFEPLQRHFSPSEGRWRVLIPNLAPLAGKGGCIGRLVWRRIEEALESKAGRRALQSADLSGLGEEQTAELLEKIAPFSAPWGPEDPLLQRVKEGDPKRLAAYYRKGMQSEAVEQAAAFALSALDRGLEGPYDSVLGRLRKRDCGWAEEKARALFSHPNFFVLCPSTLLEPWLGRSGHFLATALERVEEITPALARAALRYLEEKLPQKGVLERLIEKRFSQILRPFAVALRLKLLSLAELHALCPSLDFETAKNCFEQACRQVEEPPLLSAALRPHLAELLKIPCWRQSICEVASRSGRKQFWIGQILASSGKGWKKPLSSLICRSFSETPLHQNIARIEQFEATYGADEELWKALYQNRGNREAADEEFWPLLEKEGGAKAAKAFLLPVRKDAPAAFFERMLKAPSWDGGQMLPVFSAYAAAPPKALQEVLVKWAVRLMEDPDLPSSRLAPPLQRFFFYMVRKGGLKEAEALMAHGGRKKILSGKEALKIAGSWIMRGFREARRENKNSGEAAYRELCDSAQELVKQPELMKQCLESFLDYFTTVSIQKMTRKNPLQQIDLLWEKILAVPKFKERFSFHYSFHKQFCEKLFEAAACRNSPEAVVLFEVALETLHALIFGYAVESKKKRSSQICIERGKELLSLLEKALYLPVLYYDGELFDNIVNRWKQYLPQYDATMLFHKRSDSRALFHLFLLKEEGGDLKAKTVDNVLKKLLELKKPVAFHQVLTLLDALKVGFFKGKNKALGQKYSEALDLFQEIATAMIRTSCTSLESILSSGETNERPIFKVAEMPLFRIVAETFFSRISPENSNRRMFVLDDGTLSGEKESKELAVKFCETLVAECEKMQGGEKYFQDLAETVPTALLRSINYIRHGNFMRFALRFGTSALKWMERLPERIRSDLMISMDRLLLLQFSSFTWDSPAMKKIYRKQVSDWCRKVADNGQRTLMKYVRQNTLNRAKELGLYTEAPEEFSFLMKQLKIGKATSGPVETSSLFTSVEEGLEKAQMIFSGELQDEKAAPLFEALMLKLMKEERFPEALKLVESVQLSNALDDQEIKRVIQPFYLKMLQVSDFRIEDRDVINSLLSQFIKGFDLISFENEEICIQRFVEHLYRIPLTGGDVVMMEALTRRLFMAFLYKRLGGGFDVNTLLTIRMNCAFSSEVGRLLPHAAKLGFPIEKLDKYAPLAGKFLEQVLKQLEEEMERPVFDFTFKAVVQGFETLLVCTPHVEGLYDQIKKWIYHPQACRFGHKKFQRHLYAGRLLIREAENRFMKIRPEGTVEEVLYLDPVEAEKSYRPEIEEREYQKIFQRTAGALLKQKSAVAFSQLINMIAIHSQRLPVPLKSGGRSYWQILKLRLPSVVQDTDSFFFLLKFILRTLFSFTSAGREADKKLLQENLLFPLLEEGKKRECFSHPIALHFFAEFRKAYFQNIENEEEKPFYVANFRYLLGLFREKLGAVVEEQCSLSLWELNERFPDFSDDLEHFRV